MTEKKFELTELSSGVKSVLPVRTGTIGPDVIDIAGIAKDHDVFTFDPGFGVTAATESKITYIDGDAGVLLHRGYPDRAARREVELHGSLLPAAERRPADAAAQLDEVHRRHPASHDDQRVAAALLQRLPPQRASDGDGVGGGRLDVGVLSRLDGHP